MSETAVLHKPTLDWKFVGKLGLSLFLITAIAALVLALVNAVTADRIAQLQEAERQAALSSVMTEADSFSDLTWENDSVDGITAAYSGNDLVGYCLEVSPNGFGGAISMMVGVDLDGDVTGVAILDHSETAGLGARADSPDFLDQYIGKTSEITVNSGANAIDALSGATITSKAVTLGVNTAIEAALYYMEGGAGSNE